MSKEWARVIVVFTGVVFSLCVLTILLKQDYVYSQGVVHIYIDRSAGVSSCCGTVYPVYVRNTGSAPATVRISINKPRYINACEPRHTTYRTVHVPGRGREFLGDNRVNCSPTAGSCTCREVVYRVTR